MQWLDALSAKDIQVVGAIKVLDALWMSLTQFFRQAVLVFILKIEARARKDRILLHDFVKNVDVKGQSLSAFKLLNQLAADWASDTILVVKMLNAARAESVTTVDQDARNSFANVVLQATELTDVKTAGLVVQVR